MAWAMHRQARERAASSQPRNCRIPNAQGVVPPEGKSDVGAQHGQVGEAFGGVTERGT